MNRNPYPSVSLLGNMLQIHFLCGVEIRFPYENNPRLAKGTPEQLVHVEVSPFGIHWPDLDEDLSFEGLSRGDYGQRASADDEGAES